MKQSTFTPDIILSAVNDGYFLHFDSGASNDLGRSPTIKKISPFRALSIEVEGFDALEDGTAEFDVVLPGRFVLKYTTEQGTAQTEELAKCRIGWGIRPAKKDEEIKAVQGAKRSIQQAVAIALNEALARFSEVQQELYVAKSLPAAVPQMMSMAAPGVGALPQPGGMTPSFMRRWDDGGATRITKSGISWWWILAIPVVVFVLFYIYGKMSGTTPASTMDLSNAAQQSLTANTDAFAKNFEQRMSQITHDPAVVSSQVQLTKETLRAMGLDPDATNVDLGCLAAPPPADPPTGSQ